MRSFLFVALLLSATDTLWTKQMCCPGLRCYDDKPPFVIFPLPECPKDMGVNMKVYTRQNPKIGQTITRTSIPSSFKGDAMTMFIVHGWLQNENYTWMHEMKDAALTQDDYNVIIVGWKEGAEHPWYPQSCSNTRSVGGAIALVANNLINNGSSSKNLMYCVGHSLGAHVCGHAGQQGQFGRITGLQMIIGCNHVRAYQFFTESIGTPCFLSRQSCPTRFLLPVFCSQSYSAIQSMGFNATAYTGRGIFYLKTNSEEPFCRG